MTDRIIELAEHPLDMMFNMLVSAKMEAVTLEVIDKNKIAPPEIMKELIRVAVIKCINSIIKDADSNNHFKDRTIMISWIEEKSRWLALITKPCEEVKPVVNPVNN